MLFGECLVFLRLRGEMILQYLPQRHEVAKITQSDILLTLVNL